MTVGSGPLYALMARDIVGAVRQGGAWFHALFFFAVFIGFTVFAIGPEKTRLAELSGALVWLAAVLSVQLGVSDMFRVDVEDGTLLQIAAEEQEIFPYVAVRIFITWVMAIVPLVIFSPIAFSMFGVDPEFSWRASAVLLVGSPALVLASSAAAAVSAGIGGGGFFSSLLSAPAVIPLLIFGSSAAGAVSRAETFFNPEMLILMALSLSLLVFGPLFSTWALKQTME